MTEEHDRHDLEARQAILEDIKNFGCHLALIEEDNYLPGFVYSIGLYKNFNHPEIICFGLKTEVMGAILNHACDIIKGGETLMTEKLYSGFLEDYHVQFLLTHEAYYADYLGYAAWFYRSFEFPVLQLVWPDKKHLFPWEECFNADWKFQQPLLDRNTDFRFYEERNLGVYTTRQVLEGDPILYIYHTGDGDWQFHTSLEPNLADARIVSLEEITKLDPSVNDIYYLQYGWRAWRENKDGEWKYEEDTNDE
jgi:hypothetical protein